jgi:Protein of unknown function (DUF1597).
MRTFITRQVLFGLLVTVWLSCGVNAEAYEPFSCATTNNNCFAGYDSACCPSPWNFGGHVESGLYVNQYGQKNGYTNRAWGGDGIDWRSGNTEMLLNVRQSDLQVNQGWVFLEKKLSKRCCWDIGGRVDYVWGTDAFYMQSAGLENNAGHDYWGTGDYYSAMAQMYAELGYGRFSVKIGKFLTPMGSDPIYSPDRFFYSLSKNFGALPVTHTGALATLEVNRKLSVFGGWTQGYNEFFESSKNNAALAGFEYNLNPCTTIGYSFLWGKNTYSPWWNVNEDYFINALYMKRKLGCNWDYTLEWVYNKSKETGWEEVSYGINNSLYYTFNRNWAVGFRVEWMHDRESAGGAWGYRFAGDGYGLALGANWTPCDWFTLKPEIRYDSVHGIPGEFNVVKGGWANAKSDQLAGGVSAIVRF